MLTSILGARLSWHFANGWVFEPAIVGPERGKWRARPYYLVFRDTNGAPLRCSSCLAGRRYERLSG